MPSWSALAAVCTAVAALGVSLDRLLISSAKRRLYDWLLHAWYRLDSTSVSDLPASAAGLVLKPFESHLQHRARVTILWMMVASLALTVGSALTGRVIRRLCFPEYDAASNLPLSAGTGEIVITHTKWLFDRIDDYYRVILVNFVSDTLMVTLAYSTMLRVRDTRATWRRLALVLLSIVAACTLTVTSLYVSYQLVAEASHAARFFARASDISTAVLTQRIEQRHAVDLDDFVYAVCTLAPILSYLSVLGFLVLAKSVLGVARAVTAYLLELVVDPLPRDIEKFVPFTLTGLLFGSVGVVAKLFVELAKITGNH